MGYMPELEYAGAGCWLLLPIEAAPAQGEKLDDPTVDAIKALIEEGGPRKSRWVPSGALDGSLRPRNSSNAAVRASVPFPPTKEPDGAQLPDHWRR